MKRIVMASLVGLVSAGLLTACYYDKEEILYPGSANCTPVEAPAFNTDVLPLLEKKCNNCHSGSFPSGGISLDSFAEVMKYVNNGSLMGSINQSSGYVAMPKNAGKMPACEVANIQKWIDSGASNN